MKLDTLGVEAFVAIAEHLSFRKAARALHITQTALSRRLAGFESLLGVVLVERTTRSVALSTIGAEFLPQARRLLAELKAALLEIRDTGAARRGDVSIACVPTVGVHLLPRILGAYSATLPGNRVKILDHASSDVARAVLRREAEFGIQLGGAHHPDLETVSLFEDRFVLVCRSDHALSRKKSVAWAELAGHPLVFVGADSGNRPLLDSALATEALRLEAHYEVQRSSTAVGLVAAGLGAAIVPGLALQAGAYPRLRVVGLRAPVVSRSIVLIKRTGSQLSPAARALYDLVRDRAKSLRG